ncbi:helix-turn-helix domain-containing protein [Streptomyces sp. H27-H1]|uniref:helix-turn-helix domain-containing protein n=1 Tax=Streptomyces sp. H27-H1 TaxID=2996461 RepID=UPI002270ABE4|nr:helix-turn-helix domain-containing protein [Streptomyces sp. H27-H1]MCY0931607.1 helix-turn-helix domain-containing protein [Streptomyces sp. H27-H1]
MGSVDVFEARTAPASGGGSARRRRPPAALRPMIINYTGFHTEFTAPRRRLELPTGCVTLVFTFSDGLWVSRTEDLGTARLRPAAQAMISGPRTVPAIGVHAGVVHGLEVNMTPQGCHRLFGIPMWHFEDAHVDLADVLGPQGRFLTERLQSLPTWTERFALLDGVFGARLDDNPSPASEVSGALSGLWANTRSLSRVSAATGWSARTLRSRFREHVGLSPKAVARVFRLQHALRMLAGGTAAAHVAAACGYHDQAHLSREVKSMTGLPPSRFVLLRGGLAPGSALDRMPGRVSSVMLSG